MKDPNKHEASKNRQFSFRINIFFFSVFVLFSVLIVRLAILQFVEGEALLAEKDLGSSSTMEIPPIRGNIYDVNGYPIAFSTSTQSLYYRIQPNIVKDDAIQLAHDLSTVFNKYGSLGSSNLSAEKIMLSMDLGFDLEKNDRKILEFNHIPRRIKTDLSQSEIAYIMEHRDEYKGLEIIEESVRNYAVDGDNGIAVQLIGYLRQFSTASNPDNKSSYLDFYRDINNTEPYLLLENVGYDGIEFMYQDQLRGINGSKTYPVDVLGRITGDIELTAPTKGNNLYLTMDKDVQLATEKAIEEHLKKLQDAPEDSTYAMGKKATTGYAVAMEVQTGKVVAMASYPDYDPNIWKGGRISGKNYEAVQNYLKNGTISESYPSYKDDKERAMHPSSLVPLGSVIKPLTILLGFNEGLLTPQDTYNDLGFFEFGKDDNAKISNSGGSRHGRINAYDAIRVSSNTFMSAMIGNPLYLRAGDGIATWDSYMESFGLGVLTGSGLPNEITGTKNYLNLQAAGSAQSALIFASWGQQGRYTSLQLAQYTAMLANKGKRLKPQFVEKIQTYDGETVKSFEPVVLNEVTYPEEHWELIHGAMKLVSTSGFEDFPYTLASKTGTSTQDVAVGKVDNATFIAFAPAENPTLAVAVIVPEGGYGRLGAAPIARKIFDAYDEAFGLVK